MCRQASSGRSEEGLTPHEIGDCIRIMRDGTVHSIFQQAADGFRGDADSDIPDTEIRAMERVNGTATESNNAQRGSLLQQRHLARSDTKRHQQFSVYRSGSEKAHDNRSARATKPTGHENQSVAMAIRTHPVSERLDPGNAAIANS